MAFEALDPGEDAATAEKNRRFERRSIFENQPTGPTPEQETTADQGVPRQQTRIAQTTVSDQAPSPPPPSLEPIPQIHLQNMPQVPQGQQFTPSYDVFKDPMIVLAGLSSLFTRQPLMNAMNYASGAMTGFHQGQQDVFKQKDVQFRQALDRAIDQNKAELEKYNTAWKNKEAKDFQNSIPGLWAEAIKNNDTLMIAALRAGNPEAVFKILEGRAAADNRIANAKALMDWRYGGDRQEQAKAIAKAIEKGDQPPVVSGVLAPAVRQILADDGFNQTQAQLEWQAATKQVQSLSGPQMVRYVGLTKSVLQTIGHVQEYAEQMKQSGIYYYNEFELNRLIKTRGNTPEGRLATKYLEAVGFLKEEVANLAQGGYAPTEPAWTLANKQVNEYYGADQLNDALQEMQKLLNYRFKQIPGIETIGPGAPNPYLPQAPAAPAAPTAPGGVIKYDSQGNRINQ